MEKQNRLNLRANFRTGDRPTQENFEDVFESFLNIMDDEVSIDDNKNFSIGGGITITQSETETRPTSEGSIIYNGTTFEGLTSAGWGPIGGDGSAWQEDGNDIIFNTGNVGIGLTGNPTEALEVEVTPETGRVRFGEASIGTGIQGLVENAVFSHTNLRDNFNYSVRQRNDGTTHINSPNGTNIEFMTNNIPIAAFNSQRFILGSRDLLDANAGYRLQVQGSAFKDDGNDSWNNLSDIRTKENIQSFEEGLESLKQINPIKFKFNGKANSRKGLEAIGISAQELEEVFPYMVFRSKVTKKEKGFKDNEVLTTNLGAVKFILINAIKELDIRIEHLERASINNNIKQDE